jgi:DNA-binding GntR family transcriptional regulator
MEAMTFEQMPGPGAPRAQLREEVVAHIQGRIVAGAVTPGTLLRLAPIAEALGASITPVREALLLLAQDGWVVQEPNRGFRVLAIRRVDIEDAYLVHAFVAGELTARAAAMIDAERLERLEALDADVARLTARAPLSEGDLLQLDVLNSRLHAVIYETAASLRLAWFRDAALRFVPRGHWGAVPGWVELNRDGHREIIAALAGADADTARAAMRAHIELAGRLFTSHLEGVGFWTGERAL